MRGPDSPKRSRTAQLALLGVGRARLALAARLALVIALALALVSCKDKGKSPPPAEVAGLDAVPASATVVVSIDVAKVAGSALIKRAVEQLLLRDAGLAERWQRLRQECKIDVVGSVKHVVLALGARGETGAPVLLIATGKLSEPELSTCVRGLVGKGGGTLTARAEGGRTLYQARENNRSVWFGFGRSDTVVLGSQEAIVLEALGPGKKLADNAELRAFVDQAERKESIWAVGQVEPQVGDRLLGAADGSIRAGPRGFLFAADASSGARLALTAVMASEEDAKALESLAKRQIALLAVAAQVRGLGRLVGKISAAAAGRQLRLAIALDPTEINQLLSAVDSAALGSQDAPPAAPSQPSP